MTPKESKPEPLPQSCIDCKFRSPLEFRERVLICRRPEMWQQQHDYLLHRCGYFIAGDPIIITAMDLQQAKEAHITFPKEWEIKPSTGFVYSRSGTKLFATGSESPTMKTESELKESSTYTVVKDNNDLKIEETQSQPEEKPENPSGSDIEKTDKGYRITEPKTGIKSTSKK